MYIYVSGCNVGQKIRLETHDENDCYESQGCLERNISKVWHHEDFDYFETTNDITIAQYVRMADVSIHLEKGNHT